MNEINESNCCKTLDEITLFTEIQLMQHRAPQQLIEAYRMLRTGNFPFGYTHASIYHITLLHAAVEFWHDIRVNRREIPKTWQI